MKSQPSRTRRLSLPILSLQNHLQRIQPIQRSSTARTSQPHHPQQQQHTFPGTTATATSSQAQLKTTSSTITSTTLPLPRLRKKPKPPRRPQQPRVQMEHESSVLRWWVVEEPAVLLFLLLVVRYCTWGGGRELVATAKDLSTLLMESRLSSHSGSRAEFGATRPPSEYPAHPALRALSQPPSPPAAAPLPQETPLPTSNSQTQLKASTVTDTTRSSTHQEHGPTDAVATHPRNVTSGAESSRGRWRWREEPLLLLLPLSLWVIPHPRGLQSPPRTVQRTPSDAGPGPWGSAHLCSTHRSTLLRLRGL